MTRPREYRPAEERRTELLDAAVEVVRSGGVRAATTRTVTDRAGLPLGSFHYCFASRDVMLAALLEREAGRVLADLEIAGPSPGDPGDELLGALAAHVRRVTDDPGYHLLLHELVVVVARDSPEAAARIRRLVVREVAGALERWSRARDLSWTVPVGTLAELVLAAASGIAVAWLSTRDDEQALRTARAAGAAIGSLRATAPAGAGTGSP